MNKVSPTLELYFPKLLLLLIICVATSSFAQVHDWQRTNPGGGGAFSTIDAGPATLTGGNQIIAASDLSGAYYSWDDGQSWDVYGEKQGLMHTHVSGIGFHPVNADIFFLGVDGGIYKSSDGGSVYQVLDGGYVSDIEVSPANYSIVYAAYHSRHDINDGSIYRSVDGGEAFQQISNSSLPNGLHILEVTAHPLDENIVYILAGEGRFSTGPAVAYRSIDGGENWRLMAPSTEDVMHLAITGNTMYLTTMLPELEDGTCEYGNRGHFFKSTDSGETWGNGAIADKSGIIFTDFRQPEKIRLLDPRCPYFWVDDSGTWTSLDGGVTWQNAGLTENWGTGYISSNSPHWSYGVGYNGIAKTLGRSKADPDAIFWTNSQWTFGSFDGGTTFNPLHTKPIAEGWQSTGIDNIVMLDISANASNPDEIYVGLADMGLWHTTDGGISWIACNPEEFSGNWQGFGGNCHSVITDPDVPGKVWASLQGDDEEAVSLIYNTEAGKLDSWVKLGNGLPPNTTNLRGLSLDKTSNVDSRILFATSEGDVYRSLNNGVDWSKVLANGGLYLTRVDNLNGQIVYAGGADGLYQSTNGGITWMQLVRPPAEANNTNNDIYDEDYIGISSLEADLNNTAQLYYTYYGGESQIGGAYHWEDGVATLLYSNPYMRCVEVNPANSDQIYAGSSYSFYRGFYSKQSEGVLFSDDQGSTWKQVNGEMSWRLAVCMEITEEEDPRIIVGNTGSGIQIADVPISTDIESNSNESELVVYPNPFADMVTVKGDLSNHLIKIYNGVGGLIAEYKGDKSRMEIDLTKYPSGLYFLSLLDKYSVEYRVVKLLKE